MAKVTKEEYDAVIKQKKEAARLILKKIGLKYEDFIIEAEGSLLHEYSDLLSKEEKKKFNLIVFADEYGKAVWYNEIGTYLCGCQRSN